MRKYFVVAIVAALATFVYAQPSIQQGTRELSIEGGYDFEGPLGRTVVLDVGYGVFTSDAIELGGVLGYASDDDATTWKLGGFAEYHFDLAIMSVPYVGLRVEFVDYDVDTAFQYGPRAGIKHFLTDSVAIDIAVQYTIADTDRFNNDGIWEDTDLSLVFGMRAMF